MIQKLKSIIIENIKNVKYGEIYFETSEGFLNTTGIYGQNGSGKTTVIDVLEMIKELIQGKKLGSKYSGLIDFEEISKVRIETEILNESINRYEIVFKKVNIEGKDSIEILSETLSKKLNKKYQKFKTIIEFLSREKTISFHTLSKFELSEDALKILKSVSMENQSSFIFQQNLLKNLNDFSRADYEKKILDEFKSFANNLRIYTSEYGGLISANFMAPVSIYYSEQDSTYNGIVPVPLGPQGYLSNRFINIYKHILPQMNVLLKQIVPGITIGYDVRDTRLGESGQDEHRVEFYSTRDGKKFSLRYESDGIKKIIALLNFLIEVYNDPNIIVAIDELDSGIFEFLLGEIVSVISTGSKGQVIFTSHNLRVLEVLPKNKVVFSTTNPSNRYIRLKGVKTTNNLRDFYIRSLLVGGQEEELYISKNASNIRRALKKAGQKND
ncbi:AAA family ATPase [Lactococcus cremoris]|uniref:DNA repair ATPase n=3 Tax=Lactococcus lactis subsp. cremoris TaxID=1359 RepID=A0AAD1JZN4_LACLC|nr:AAA family ATPase [Lactococcus cremoris]ADJ61212.1 putative abortive phage resistance [Lactococcus cremoris subsp. cremoris NZ9000]KKW69884.1 phosphonate ABC transporter, ATP-binding protein, phnC [Lactococcus cremoris]KZK50679.1 abortive phage resistance protein [Lactococcus cremoris]MCT4435881.1 ATP-binding protein [Lactococcus cremoris]MCT4445590.1 ATP-binding protein [Lactococcus cremoris]